MKTIAVVIPVFNEESAIKNHLQKIISKINEITDVKFMVLVIDDGSTDNTVKILKELCKLYEQLNIICLSRHFGKEAAIYAGLSNSNSDAVIVMDSDLQHPPELIRNMISLWLQRIDIVEAYKVSRGKESWFSRFMAQVFYNLFISLTNMNIKNHSDFKLLDRKIVNIYCELSERKRFFRGLINWVGFPTAQIPFGVPERIQGDSNWSRLKLFKYSINAITSFSSIPLQIISFLGLATFTISIILGCIALYHKFSGYAVSGFTTVILLILLIGSFLMFGLGLIGIYISHIYDEVKKRPIYLIDWDRSQFIQKKY